VESAVGDRAGWVFPGLLLAIFGVIVCGTFAGSSAGALRGVAPVPTLLADVPGGICAFAQDGARIAWWAESGLGASAVSIQDLRTRTRTRVGTAGDTAYGCLGLALAGRRVLWTELSGSNSEADAEIFTNSPANRKGRVVGTLGFERDPDSPREPQITVRVAGDAATLVFIDASDASVCSCPPDRGVRRVTGRGSVRLPGVIGAYALAASGKRIAILSDTNTTRGRDCLCDVDPAWAPDGKRIAFAGTPEGDYRFSAIEVVPARGGRPVKLTHKIVGDTYFTDLEPDWSPDGSKIAFVRIASGSPFGSRRLFVMNADGSGQRMLSQSEASSPAWSPDGMKIAFVRLFPDPGIYTVNADGTGQRRITTSDRDGDPDWSPDGSRLAFEHFGQGESDIEIMNADGSGTHRIATGAEPAWSPDGTRIAFESGGYPEVHIAYLDGSGDRRVASGSSPAWSPDGRQLAVVDNPTKDVNQPATDIYVVPAAGGDAVRATTATLDKIKPTLQIHDARTGALLARVQLDDGAREVALSDSFAAVLAADGAKAHVSLYGRDGSRRGSVSVPPHATDLSIAGSRAIFRTGATIWLLDARKRKTMRLTTSKDALIGLSIDGNRIAWADNARGHGRIHALLLPP
jgi:Tol biopolymer transport system component